MAAGHWREQIAMQATSPEEETLKRKDDIYITHPAAGRDLASALDVLGPQQPRTCMLHSHCLLGQTYLGLCLYHTSSAL